MTKEQIEQMADRWESFECNENGARRSFIEGANSQKQENDDLLRQVETLKLNQVPEGYYVHYGSGKYWEDEPVLMRKQLKKS